jgi:xanthine dehydrogenase YagS FAD-binding subunit
VLAPGELIQSVALPPPPPGRQLYRKVRDRASFAFALVSVAVVVAREDDRVRAARVAFGGISYKPSRSAEAEAALVGASVTRASFDAAGRAALGDARGYGSNDFKNRLPAGPCAPCWPTRPASSEEKGPWPKASSLTRLGSLSTASMGI